MVQPLFEEIRHLDREIRRLRSRLDAVTVGTLLNPSSFAGIIPPSSGGSGTGGSPLGVTLWENQSGAPRSQGAVLIQNGDRTFGVTATAGDLDVIGVLDDNAVAVGANGRVRHVGYQSVVDVQGAVVAGDFLRTSATSGRAEDAGATPKTGTFAIALTAAAGPGAGTVAAYLFAAPSVTGDGIIIVPVLASGDTYIWVDQPAALTELLGKTQYRSQVDLTNASRVRLVADVVTGGVAGSQLRGQYSLNGGGTWAYLDGASGPAVAIDVAGAISSAWVDLEAAAKADVLLRVAGILGDAAGDPALGLVYFEFSGQTVAANPSGLDNVRVLDEVGQLDIVNLATEQTFYSYTIPANLLSTKRAVRLTIAGDYLNNSGGTRTITLRVYYGATKMYDDVTTTIAASATRRPFWWDFILGAEGSAAAQVLGAKTNLGNVGATTAGLGDLSAAPTIAGNVLFGTAAENSALDQLFSVTVQHSTNHASLSIRRRYAVLELV